MCYDQRQNILMPRVRRTGERHSGEIPQLILWNSRGGGMLPAGVAALSLLSG
jgi:hypothetical protein